MKLDALTDVQSHVKRSVMPSSEHELAWSIGGENSVAHGTKDQVKISPDKPGTWIAHTHPAEEPSWFTALPSEQDLKSLVDMDIPGIVVLSGQFFTIVKQVRDNPTIVGYEQALASGDMDTILGKLKSMSFDVKFGEKSS